MAGVNTTLNFDPAYAQYQSWRQVQQNDYVMNLNAVYRQGQPPIRSLSVANQPSFYGPLRGSLVSQESFLQGRGQVLGDAPEFDVRMLPESLFPSHTESNEMPACQRTDLEPLQTRMRKSCNGIEEVDMSQYWMIPGAWQATGYSGPASGVNGNLQTRQAPNPDPSIRQGSEDYGTCRQNYGSFSVPGNRFAPYGN